MAYPDSKRKQKSLVIQIDFENRESALSLIKEIAGPERFEKREIVHFIAPPTIHGAPIELLVRSAISTIESLDGQVIITFGRDVVALMVADWLYSRISKHKPSQIDVNGKPAKTKKQFTTAVARKHSKARKVRKVHSPSRSRRLRTT